MKPAKHIGAIFIAYNAERTLAKFYQEFPRSLVQTMILVDDASQDGTYELAKNLGIQAYKNPINLGYGGNMKRALRMARELGMDVIVDLHPDGEYDSSAIPAALQAVENGCDFVLGNRFTGLCAPLRSGMLLWKMVPIVALNLLARLVLNARITDLHQGFRVYTRRMLDHIDYEGNSNGFLFSFELIAQAIFANLRIGQVPVKTRYAGKKRGASLKHSVYYSIGVLKVCMLFLAAKLGVRSGLFRNVKKST